MPESADSGGGTRGFGTVFSGLSAKAEEMGKTGEEIMEIFKKLNEEGMTIIQVTHSEKNAMYGDRLIRLVDGQVEADMSPDELKASLNL